MAQPTATRLLSFDGAGDEITALSTTPRSKVKRSVSSVSFESSALKTTGARSAKHSLIPSHTRASSRRRLEQSRRDRFIPIRRFPDSWTKSFQINKSSQQDSTSGRDFIQGGLGSDPFRSEDRSRNTRVLRPNSQRPVVQRPHSTRPDVTGRSGHRLGLESTPGDELEVGSVWRIGGTAALADSSPPAGIPNGRGGLLGSGTNAPMYISRFLESDYPDQDLEKHEQRLALAFGFEQASNVFEYSSSAEGSQSFSSPERDASLIHPTSRKRLRNMPSPISFQNNEWVNECSPSFLDAPYLRDDFYCTLLAYSATAHTIAVGLHYRVYIWSEARGVRPMSPLYASLAYLTSLAFSSTEGGNSILAIGRADGQISLWSLYDVQPRFEIIQPSPISSLAWKPRVSSRLSQRPKEKRRLASCEELLVGDEAGDVYYYSVEWPNKKERHDNSWHGAMFLLAKISVHSQQICGLTWAPEGDFFATGGNDNICCVFDANMVLKNRRNNGLHLNPLPKSEDIVREDGSVQRKILPDRVRSRTLGAGREKHKWLHGAAVKAIAFCPWQKGLLATGGGSNDRCIHFYHVYSGACLATIDVAAQVTSLIWSTGRREIAATFGYSQPDHPYRIAVFSWPECRQVAAVPWMNDLRALSAISYPGGPNKANSQKDGKEGGTWLARTAKEGCLVVAASDETVKFHEIWSGPPQGTSGMKGVLGGSVILEGLEGIDREGDEVIR
ncbi:MAG: Rab geranylgeranyltransferase [Chaenotheca gracillima]|nr:MAG: Rab geranylgeranyltransferase [Chaenotheca gracillima]